MYIYMYRYIYTCAHPPRVEQVEHRLMQPDRVEPHTVDQKPRVLWHGLARHAHAGCLLTNDAAQPVVEPVRDIMHRVHAQTVTAILQDPHAAGVEQILLHLGAVERELLAPWGIPSAPVEVNAPVIVRAVAVPSPQGVESGRPVIQADIHHNCQPELMGSVHKRPHVLRGAVGGVNGHTRPRVVAPRPAEFGHGH